MRGSARGGIRGFQLAFDIDFNAVADEEVAPLPVFHPGDLPVPAVHPAFRGAGVMTRMREYASARPRLFEIYFGIRSGHEAIHRLRRTNVGVGFHTEADVLVRVRAAADEQASSGRAHGKRTARTRD